MLIQLASEVEIIAENEHLVEHGEIIQSAKDEVNQAKDPEYVVAPFLSWW